MEHLNEGCAQQGSNAQSAYAQQQWQIAPPATEIRDASLRNKADETDNYLLSAHALLNELEDALHGPQPRDGKMNGGNPIPGHPGLRSVLSSNGTLAASLVNRLQTLIGSL